MILSVAGYKGGTAKTSTSVALAGLLNERAPTLLADGDANRSALQWASHGNLPFKVVDERQAIRHVRDYEHVVIDTAARPSTDDIKEIAAISDLIVLPTVPEALAMGALLQTVDDLTRLAPDAQYRALVTIIPPKPSRDGEEAQQALRDAGVPVFHIAIRRAVAMQRASLSGLLPRDVDDPRAAALWGDYQALLAEIDGVLTR